MSIRRRTAKEIEAIRKRRASKPREKYSLHAHERRELAVLASEIEVLDRAALVNLSNYFVVTLGTIAENLRNAGFEIADGQAQQVEPKKAPERKRKRKTLGLGGLPKQTIGEQALEVETEDAQVARSELEMLKSRLAQKEREIMAREREALERERVAEQQIIEAEEAIRAADARADELAEEIDAVRNTRVVRKADATQAKLYTPGYVRWLLESGMRDRDLRIAELEKELRNVEWEFERLSDSQPVERRKQPILPPSMAVY